MKALAYSLVTVTSLALSSAVFAASEKYDQMSGTVVEADVRSFVIETADKQSQAFHMEQAGKPKVGEKVTVYYHISQHDHWGTPFAMKVEKAGKSGKGSKKN
jgi:hypothetical protein